MKTMTLNIIDDGFTSIIDAQDAAACIGARVGKKTAYDNNDRATTIYFIYDYK